jgi:hypothetical protein
MSYKLRCEFPKRIDEKGNLLDAMAGAAFESAFLEATLARGNLR